MPGRNRATLWCRGSWMRGDAAASPAHAATVSATRCPPSEYGVDAPRDVAPVQHLCQHLLLDRITWLGGGRRLLPARCVTIGLRVIHHHAVIQIGDAHRDVFDRACASRHV